MSRTCVGEDIKCTVILINVKCGSMFNYLLCAIIRSTSHCCCPHITYAYWPKRLTTWCDNQLVLLADWSHGGLSWIYILSNKYNLLIQYTPSAVGVSLWKCHVFPCKMNQIRVCVCDRLSIITCVTNVCN